MKSLNVYLTESKKQYDLRVKLAVPLGEKVDPDIDDKMDVFFKRYNPDTISSARKLMISSFFYLPLMQSIYMLDRFLFNYPL